MTRRCEIRTRVSSRSHRMMPSSLCYLARTCNAMVSKVRLNVCAAGLQVSGFLHAVTAAGRTVVGARRDGAARGRGCICDQYHRFGRSADGVSLITTKNNTALAALAFAVQASQGDGLHLFMCDERGASATVHGKFDVSSTAAAAWCSGPRAPRAGSSSTSCRRPRRARPCTLRWRCSSGRSRAPAPGPHTVGPARAPTPAPRPLASLSWAEGCSTGAQCPRRGARTYSPRLAPAPSPRPAGTSARRTRAPRWACTARPSAWRST